MLFKLSLRKKVSFCYRVISWWLSFVTGHCFLSPAPSGIYFVSKACENRKHAETKREKHGSVYQSTSINTSESRCVSFPLSLWSLVVRTKWCVKAWRIHSLSFITFQGLKPLLDNFRAYALTVEMINSTSVMQTFAPYVFYFMVQFNVHFSDCFLLSFC